MRHVLAAGQETRDIGRQGVTGKLGTITRSDGTAQATYNGDPLYTYVGDTAPGQAKGNGLNASGGVWHEVTVSGSAAAASTVILLRRERRLRVLTGPQDRRGPWAHDPQLHQRDLTARTAG